MEVIKSNGNTDTVLNYYVYHTDMQNPMRKREKFFNLISY